MKNLAIIKIHHSFFPILITVCFVFHLSTALSAEGNELSKRLAQEQCSTGYNFEGQAESRFKLKAPARLWGGSKFQRDWLIRYLYGKRG